VDRVDQEVAMDTPRIHRLAARPRVLAILLLVAALPVATRARATISVLEVIPAQPTIADSVSIHVAGYYPNGCWHPGPVVCGFLAGHSISISEHAVEDTMRFCPLIVPEYGATCEYGRLPAGIYQVVFTETHTSVHDPLPQQRTLNFRVSDATPTRLKTWGRLKLLYR
jgi:hypothetical protein